MSTMSEFLGGSGAVNWQRMVLQSGTFTAPFAGSYLIAAIGGGGSGAKGSLYRAATGGAAGGVAMKMVYLTAGQALTLLVGAGGAAVSGQDNAAGADGVAGGNTTVTGTGVALTANGGAGGIQTVAFTGTLTAPIGGTATGGDLNVMGGSSDSITLSASGIACGGAAVGIYGYTPPNATVSSGAYVSWGGGSVLGSSGYAQSLASSGPIFGNALGAAARYVSKAQFLDRLQQSATPTTYAIPYGYEGEAFRGGNLLCPNGLRGVANSGLVAFIDGDAGAGGAQGSLTSFLGGGGVYAGGAGACVSAIGVNAGAGGILGGGGGAVSTSSANGSMLTSGKGGVGGVVIQFLGA